MSRVCTCAHTKSITLHLYIYIYITLHCITLHVYMLLCTVRTRACMRACRAHGREVCTRVAPTRYAVARACMQAAAATDEAMQVKRLQQERDLSSE